MKKKLFLCLLSIVTTLLFCELGVRFFVKPRSSGICTGALSHSWTETHVNFNSEGFRDSEFTSKNSEDSVIFIGDSFTFGQGVEIDKIFFSIANNQITDKEFYNLGTSGANTIAAQRRLMSVTKKFAIKPSDVIFQHYFNDIDYLVNFQKAKTNFSRKFLQTPQLVSFANVSFLFDYLYHPFLYRSFSSNYSEIIFDAFKDEKIMSEHLLDILKVYKIAKDLGANFHFLVFPNINNLKLLKESDAYISKLQSLYIDKCDKGDSWIDVSKLLLTMDESTWRLNSVDGHPSVNVHMNIGEVLVDAINRNKNDFIHFHD